MAKIETFPLGTGYSCTNLQIKNSLEFALSLTVSKIFSMFYFPLKCKRTPKVAKIEIFPLCIGYPCTALQVKNSLEITLSVTVFEIFTPFHFPLKCKMAAQSGENWNFSPRHRTLLYYPVVQKYSKLLYLLRFSRYSQFFIIR